jgi:hypothetical protein
MFEHDINTLMMRVNNNLVPKIFDLSEEPKKDLRLSVEMKNAP